MILLPIKILANAKQRLASVLEQQARTELAQAMLRDVVETLAAYAGDGVSMATSDPFAIELAGQYGFEVIRDESNVSETDAIEMATRVCESRGIESTLVIPGDIPLIEAADIRAIYDSSPQTGSVLVPSGDKRGTNAVLRQPLDRRVHIGGQEFTADRIFLLFDETCVVRMYDSGNAFHVINDQDFRPVRGECKG